jgi:hypothetical protein
MGNAVLNHVYEVKANANVHQLHAVEQKSRRLLLGKRCTVTALAGVQTALEPESLTAEEYVRHPSVLPQHWH